MTNSELSPHSFLYLLFIDYICPMFEKKSNYHEYEKISIYPCSNIAAAVR